MDKYIISYLNVNNEIESKILITDNIKLDIIFNYLVNLKNIINKLELLCKYDIYIKLYNMIINNKQHFKSLITNKQFLPILKKLKNIQIYIYKKYKSTYYRKPLIYLDSDIVKNNLSIYNNYFIDILKNDSYKGHKLSKYYIELLDNFRNYHNTINTLLIENKILKRIAISLYNSMKLSDIDINYAKNLKVYLLLNDKLLTINTL